MTKILCLSLFLSFFGFIISSAQQRLGPDIYMVQFTDKNYNSFSLSKPEEFLSERALTRRNNQSINIDENDLPVSIAYTDSLKQLGFDVLQSSKWLNAAIIYVPNDSLLQRLHGKSYLIGIKSAPQKAAVISTQNSKILESTSSSIVVSSEYYGKSYEQLTIHNGTYLHSNGYFGKGMLIAVLDGGFSGALDFSSLQTLWTENRVVLKRDIVDKTGTTFYKLAHGANVLSIMAGNYEGRIVGSAPEASYALIRTEDAHTESSGLLYEYPVEEFYWVVGAELADSIGADLINSSLGYCTFNDTTLNHTYSEMDGKTTICAQGANTATSKGMIVVVSTGNEGDGNWKYITTPADAKNILAVGAIDSDKKIAAFSSRGPSADGRIKPEVVAIGKNTFLQSGSSSFTYGNGTSFSAPIITGLAACLWQAFPNKTNKEIINAIIKCSSQYNSPDTIEGFGIPNFQTAYNSLNSASSDSSNSDSTAVGSILYNNEILISPNPTDGKFTVTLGPTPFAETQFKIFGIEGRLILHSTKITSTSSQNIIDCNELINKPKGIYILQIQSGNSFYKKKIVKI
jgi:serine protease AprX